MNKLNLVMKIKQKKTILFYFFSNQIKKLFDLINIVFYLLKLTYELKLHANFLSIHLIE